MTTAFAFWDVTFTSAQAFGNGTGNAFVLFSVVNQVGQLTELVDVSMRYTARR
ncbi:MAG: hypothetical protein H6730_21655 [Deltaproteobacteria bacterium]|nr:hypothetical protein [Deltaproteobacteria bacterium]